MKLALLTPWPNQPSGIADYAFDLAGGLAAIGEQVTVYTNPDIGHAARRSPLSPRSHHRFPDEAAQYDCIVYQMGNDPRFHAWMLTLLQRYGGIVHLHDVVLQHLLAWVAMRAGKAPQYLGLVERWYGAAVREHVAEMLRAGTSPWETPVVTEIPLFEEVVQHADSCIVHSQFARTRIQSAFPGKRTDVVPQLYKLPSPPTKASPRQALRVGIFGGVQPNRQVELSIQVLSEVSRDAARGVELVVVGAIEKVSQGIQKLAKSLGHPLFSTSFRGRVESDEFHALLASCDLVLSLRYPTMGETSAVVMKSLQYRVPTIVTRIGWYAELPDAVRKLDPENMRAQLTALLSEFLSRPEAMASWKSACADFAAAHLNFDASVRDYRQHLLRACGRRMVERQLAQGLLRSGLADPGAALLESIVSRLADPLLQ